MRFKAAAEHDSRNLVATGASIMSMSDKHEYIWRARYVAELNFIRTHSGVRYLQIGITRRTLMETKEFWGTG